MSYATLGTSCRTNMRSLTDNTKFFPLNNPLYFYPIYTQMQRYPATNVNMSSLDLERPEDIKTKKIEPKTEEYSSNAGDFPCRTCGPR